MNIKDFRFTDWSYSAKENGMETRVRIAYHDGLAAVLQITKDEDGRYYYGVFCDYCDEQTINDRQSFLRFLEKNETNGYSCGSFDTLEELNAQMQEDGVTGYGTITTF